MGAPPVVGLGLCCVDMLFRVPRPPVFGGLMRADAYLRQGGGPVPTALVAVSRLGEPTRFVGRVGDDDDGRFIRDGLAAEGVDVSRLEAEAGALSRVALVLVDQRTGERGFTARPETCRPLAAADLRRDDFQGVRVVHLDDADEAALQAARWGHQAGALVVLDGTWVHDDLAQLLPWVDAPVVSEPFARAWMPGATPAEVLEALWIFGPRVAVLTLGAQGVAARWADGTVRLAAYPVETADTTGAGDAFHGGFIYGLLQQWEWERTLRFASALAALNCRQLGGRTGLPRRVEVEAFLEATPPPAMEAL